MENPSPIAIVSIDPRGEFPFAPADYLFVLLYSITALRDHRLEAALKPSGLSLARYRALLVISKFEPCTMTELADFTLVERTTLTRTVDSLVSEGWVARVSRAADRRQVILTLSEAGRGLIAKAGAMVAAENRDILEGISDKDQRALVRLCQDLASNLALDPPSRERVLTFRRPARRA